MVVAVVVVVVVVLMWAEMGEGVSEYSGLL